MKAPTSLVVPLLVSLTGTLLRNSFLIIQGPYIRAPFHKQDEPGRGIGLLQIIFQPLSSPKTGGFNDLGSGFGVEGLGV